MQLKDGVVDVDFTINWSEGIGKKQFVSVDGVDDDGEGIADDYMSAFQGETNLEKLLNEITKMAGGGGGKGGGGGQGSGGSGGGGGGDCQCEDCCPELTEQVLEAVSERVDGVVESTMVQAGIEAEAKVTEAVKADLRDKVDAAMAALREELAETEKRIKAHKQVEVSLNGEDFKPLEGASHVRFPELLRMVATKNPVMMVGPAGSGKTYAALQVARALELDFYANSVCAQTSESKLLGYMNATGGYVTTEFRKAFEQGGVYLMDEIDAGNPNVIVVMNAALSSEFCAFPDGMVKKHENFLFIAAANTFGTGADRQYVGRNQLDLATLDRFIMLEWEYDKVLEASLVAHHSWSRDWLKVIEKMREVVFKNGWRLIISPRATMQGATLLANGFSFEEVMLMRVIPTASKDQRTKLMEEAQKIWNGAVG